MTPVEASFSVDAYQCRGGGRSSADPLGKARSASLRRQSSPYSVSMSSSSSSGKSASPMPAVAFGGRESVGGLIRRSAGEVQQKVSVQFPDLPPELQGVSVKDLVKALGMLYLFLITLVRVLESYKLVNAMPPPTSFIIKRTRCHSLF